MEQVARPVGRARAEDRPQGAGQGQGREPERDRATRFLERQGPPVLHRAQIRLAGRLRRPRGRRRAQRRPDRIDPREGHRGGHEFLGRDRHRPRLPEDGKPGLGPPRGAPDARRRLGRPRPGERGLRWRLHVARHRHRRGGPHRPADALDQGRYGRAQRRRLRAVRDRLPERHRLRGRGLILGHRLRSRRDPLERGRRRRGRPRHFDVDQDCHGRLMEGHHRPGGPRRGRQGPPGRGARRGGQPRRSRRASILDRPGRADGRGDGHRRDADLPERRVHLLGTGLRLERPPESRRVQGRRRGQALGGAVLALRLVAGRGRRRRARRRRPPDLPNRGDRQGHAQDGHRAPRHHRHAAAHHRIPRPEALARDGRQARRADRQRHDHAPGQRRGQQHHRQAGAQARLRRVDRLRHRALQLQPIDRDRRRRDPRQGRLRRAGKGHRCGGQRVDGLQGDVRRPVLGPAGDQVQRRRYGQGRGAEPLPRRREAARLGRGRRRGGGLRAGGRRRRRRFRDLRRGHEPARRALDLLRAFPRLARPGDAPAQAAVHGHVRQGQDERSPELLHRQGQACRGGDLRSQRRLPQRRLLHLGHCLRLQRAQEGRCRAAGAEDGRRVRRGPRGAVGRVDQGRGPGRPYLVI